MSLSSTTNRVSYIGDGSSATFSFPYEFFTQSDLAVYLYDTLTGLTASQALNTNYTVSGATNANGIYNNGGNVVMASAIISTTYIVITRDPSEVQNFILQQNAVIPSASLTQQFDYLTLLVQRLNDKVSRNVALSDGFGGTFNSTLPTINQSNAFLALCLNSSATGFVWGLSGSSTISVSASSVVGVIPIANGGTGQITANAAYNALTPINTTGDLVIYGSNAAAIRLAAATSGFIFTAQGAGTQPIWKLFDFSATGSGFLSIANGGTGGNSYVSGSGAVQISGYVSGSGALQIGNNLSEVTKATAWKNLSPTTTWGDTIYAGSGAIGTALAAGSPGQVLTTQGVGAAPSWTSIAAGSTALLAVATKTASYNATTADNVILCNSGAMTINLFSVAGNSGRTITVKKVDAGTGIINIVGSAATIDGSSALLSTQNESRQFVCDGTNWQTLSIDIPSNWTSFTPTGAWLTGSTIYTGFWRRLGDSMHVRTRVSTVSAPANTGFTINLPTGYTLDLVKINPNAENIAYVGGGLVRRTTGNTFPVSTRYTTGSNAVSAYTIISNTTGSSFIDLAINNVNPFTFANGDNVQLDFTVPILGWQG